MDWFPRSNDPSIFVQFREGAGWVDHTDSSPPPRYQRVDFDPSFDLNDEHLVKLVKRFSTELRHLSLGSKETSEGTSLLCTGFLFWTPEPAIPHNNSVFPRIMILTKP